MSDLLPLTGNATVMMVINDQPVTIEVKGADAPLTGGNFVDLVERGFYDGISFHRVENDPRFSLVQGGDPNSKDPSFPVAALGRAGFTDPTTQQQRFIPLEIKPAGEAEPIYNQTFTGVEPVLRNQRGSVAMARSEFLDSASSQFYVNLVDIPSLDGAYAVFGNVTSGLEALDGLQVGDRIAAARVIGGTIPSRTSTIMSNNQLLNDLTNFANSANLPLRFSDFSDSDDTINLTPEMLAQASSGVRGGAGNDTIIGSMAADVAIGGQGNDTINGEAGNDYLRGDMNDDSLFGGEGNDIINGNLGNDVVDGGTGDDFLRGGKDNDTLTGGDGNDYLSGDLGTDILTGGGGADTFIFRADSVAAAGDLAAADRVLDFNAGEGDRLGIAGITDLAEIAFNASGADTLIQLSDGSILGMIENAAVDAVRNAAFATGFGDAALKVG
ncbi:MAG TPA: peptidylprolyl isomerase [Oscillatoriaceae cyanobacterium M33_DOE_052]|uniref:peptidylprolyl isomerase n=1 Tax=Planktothricoides sp. SpSt-374 TaxID=2282167 RepID=A0A7C3ZQ79_9CYAN|nr:peptidylprolyl isomerase [Oscillatoriaceae cyanobacterium M33_DOE_052]